MVTGKLPLPIGLPSTNSSMFAGTPLPLAISALPVGVNSKPKIEVRRCVARHDLCAGIIRRAV
jgi:hypothetical protein